MTHEQKRPRGHKTRILIMDQHPRVRSALSVRLRSVPHYNVLGAESDLPTTLSRISETHPDVVLYGLDSNHGRSLNGSLHKVQRIVQTGVGVVVLSPYVDEVERDLLLSSGVKGYVLKQIDTHGLIDRIDTVALGLTAT